MPEKGLLITFEGIDGSGKTTQAKRLAASLGSDRAFLTKEPGGTPVGQILRSILLDPALVLDPQAELYLFLADRAQHVKTCVLPQLETGKTVIVDRFIDATVAYQGYGLNHPAGLIKTIHHHILGHLLPDKTFLFDLDPPKARERIEKRGDRKTSVENRPEDFFHRVREGYLTIARENPDRFIVLDALLPEHELSGIILREVTAMQGHRPPPASSGHRP